MGKRIKLFVASHCDPCKIIVDKIQEGKFSIDGDEGEVELIDVEEEEHFSDIEKHNLSKLPMAMTEEGKFCKIIEEEDGIYLECGED